MAVVDKVRSIIVEQLGVDEEEVTSDASFVAIWGPTRSTGRARSWRSRRSRHEIPDGDAEKKPA